MVGERQTYMMDVPKMAKKLTDLGFIELFHRLTPGALESIWNLPGAAKTLELHVSGRTIRRQDNLTAVAIDRHDFRTLLLPDPADRASSASTTE